MSQSDSFAELRRKIVATNHFDENWWNRVTHSTEIIEKYESAIDDNEDVYLITWVPDPVHLPDADFVTQHMWCVDLLALYLSTCEVGLFCVEATQQGNPHYHGWYQISDEREEVRIAIHKVLKWYAPSATKITKVKSTYKTFNWFKPCNALYYYKKSIIGSMYDIPINVITSESESLVDWELMASNGFFDKTIDQTLRDKINKQKYLLDFYTNSLSILK